MDSETIRARLRQLREKYEPLLQLWFSKNDESHYQHPHYRVMEKTLRGEIEVHSEPMLTIFINWLEKSFPEIVLDDSDDEDRNVQHPVEEIQPNQHPIQEPQVNHLPVEEKVQKQPIKRTISTQTCQSDIPQPDTVQINGIITPPPEKATFSFTSPFPLPPELPSSTPIEQQPVRRNMALKSTAKQPKTSPKSVNRPEKPQGSIAEYKTKTSTLKPASAYAKASDQPRSIISVPYKQPTTSNSTFNPKDEATKLQGIKEKIYMKAYLNKNEQKTKNLTAKEDSNNNSLNSSKSSGNSKSSNSSGKKRQNTRKALSKEKNVLTKSRLRKKRKRINYFESSSESSTSESDETTTDDDEESSEEEYEEIPISRGNISRRTRSALKKLRMDAKKRILRKRRS